MRKLAAMRARYGAKQEIAGYAKHHKLSGTWSLTDWNGNDIVHVIRPVKTWKTPRSHISTTMTQFVANINGRRFTGRGSGDGMLLVLKATYR